MNKIDLIIDALYKTKLLMDGHGQYPHTLREVSEALAAARELQQELAKPEQEPVCDKDPSLCGFVQCQLGKTCKNTPINTMPTKIFGPNLEQILNAAGFYRREWVGLTQEERDELLNGSTRIPSRLIDWVEQKLKEKNGAL